MQLDANGVEQTPKSGKDIGDGVLFAVWKKLA